MTPEQAQLLLTAHKLGARIEITGAGEGEIIDLSDNGFMREYVLRVLRDIAYGVYIEDYDVVVMRTLNVKLGGKA